MSFKENDIVLITDVGRKYIQSQCSSILQPTLKLKELEGQVYHHVGETATFADHIPVTLKFPPKGEMKGYRIYSGYPSGSFYLKEEHLIKKHSKIILY